MAVPREVEQASNNNVLSPRCGHLSAIDAQGEFSAVPAPIADQFERMINPDHWPSMRVLFYLQMPEIPAPLKPLALAAIDELAREVRQGRL